MPLQDWPVTRCPRDGCWVWQGRADKDGYGRSGKELAYQVVYRAERGAVPADKTLDHLCRNRLCVNPAHLEPVTKSEQEWRKGWGGAKGRAAMRSLPCGCEYQRNVRLTRQGGKVCRRCS